MHAAERLIASIALPPDQGRLEQAESAIDIGFHKRARAIDRAIDMGFGSEVYDGIGACGFEEGLNRRTVCDAGMNVLYV